MPGPTRFIGCGLGKAAVVIFDSQTGRSWSVSNEVEALSALLATFEPTCLVVCESTGGYEGPLLQAALLSAVGFDAQIDRLDRAIAALIGRDPALARDEAALRSIAGIGPKTAPAPRPHPP